MVVYSAPWDFSWSIFTLDNDLQFHHVPCTKNLLVDCLSKRRDLAVVEAQQADDLAHHRQQLQEAHDGQLSTEDAIICTIHLIPATIWKEVHRGHFGLDKTWKDLQKTTKLWIRQDVIERLNTSQACQQFKRLQPSDPFKYLRDPQHPGNCLHLILLGH